MEKFFSQAYMEKCGTHERILSGIQETLENRKF